MIVVNRKKIVIEILLIFIFIVVNFLFFSLYWGNTLVKKYDGYVYPNIYINDKDISMVKIMDLDNIIEKINEEFISKEIKFKTVDKEYAFHIKDLGVSINKEKLINDITLYCNDSSFINKVIKATGNSKKVFSYELTYDDKNIDLFLTNLKSKVDTLGSDGMIIIDDNRNVIYQKALSSFDMDILKTKVILIKTINNKFNDNIISLVGDSSLKKDDDTLKQIDTKTSSYSTKYNRFISRGRNLEAGLNYLDGQIIYPGDVFSFFKIAGPYSKKGYAWYDGMIGNGVCQIASTIYNTALNGGLEIVERYPHDHLLEYIPGGQDATVASIGYSSLADFKFKNTYKYPIYISAYYKDGIATVDFWSNHDAKEGYEYYVESIQTGYKRYTTYLHKTKDGVEVSKDFIANTYYYK